MQFHPQTIIVAINLTLRKKPDYSLLQQSQYIPRPQYTTNPQQKPKKKRVHQTRSEPRSCVL